MWTEPDLRRPCQRARWVATEDGRSVAILHWTAERAVSLSQRGTEMRVAIRGQLIRLHTQRLPIIAWRFAFSPLHENLELVGIAHRYSEWICQRTTRRQSVHWLIVAEHLWRLSALTSGLQTNCQILRRSSPVISKHEGMPRRISRSSIVTKST
jgi:hypothetical protein